jgi:glycosyltransferase involved in cell wall biosynthesis
MTSSANAAKIVSVSGHDRPMWSVLIPVYNCARYLEETLAGVLSQDPGETVMEIIVIDDCSSDDPGEVVERLAGSRARFIRQTENVGKIRNYETGLNESRGILIHQLHGDDRVRPGFYRSMELAFNS